MCAAVESSESEEDNIPEITVDEVHEIYLATIWMLSVRPVRHMNRFAPTTLLFQPDTRLFCHHGGHCRITNTDHISRYCHDLPQMVSGAKSSQNPLVKLK